MLISNHSPFVKVWVIIQLIAKHLNWWMWIGYVKFNMFHLKISHWIFEDSLWFSSRIRSFSGSFVVFETSWEQKPACILTWPVQRTESCSIIPQLPRFLSVQTQWAIEKTCQQEVQSLWDVDELMGFWSMNILSYYRISHVYPIPYTHISLFEFNQNPFFSIQMRCRQSWLFSVQKPTKAKRCLFTFLPHVFFGAQWFFDWANRHVPRKNAIERIESTIGKSDLGEKAWCLKIASRSLFVTSNLEESTYIDTVHTWTKLFVCRKQVMSMA